MSPGNPYVCGDLERVWWRGSGRQRSGLEPGGCALSSGFEASGRDAVFAEAAGIGRGCVYGRFVQAGRKRRRFRRRVGEACRQWLGCRQAGGLGWRRYAADASGHGGGDGGS